jgi:hypothetical protein
MANVLDVTPELMANGFENTICAIPGTITVGQGGIRLFWKYKELKKEDIVANDNHQSASKGGTTFSKVLNVSLNDGLPTHVPSDKGGTRFNDKKAMVTLTFTGKVVGNQ